MTRVYILSFAILFANDKFEEWPDVYDSQEELEEAKKREAALQAELNKTKAKLNEVLDRRLGYVS